MTSRGGRNGRMSVAKASKKPGNRPALEIDDYLATLTPEARSAVRKIRSAIRAAAPKVTESISYGIPTFRLDGRPLIYCAAWKSHTSLYPLTAAIRRAHAAELKKHETSKGTIRFPLATPVPIALVKKLVKARLAELRARGKQA